MRNRLSLRRSASSLRQLQASFRRAFETLELRRLMAVTDDWGDAPDSYGTLAVSNGAHHTATPNLRLGANVDAEVDGIPTAAANGDDLNNTPDDEDGVVFTSTITPGGTTTVTVSLGGGAGRLNAWMDFNHNGSFDPFEQIFTNQAVVFGANSLSFLVPSSALPGTTYSRWRLSANGAVSPGPKGFGGFGEVEDYVGETIPHTDQKYDFGDAPDTYKTLLASNGPRHLATPNLHLGSKIDIEADGNPSPLADGDDLLGGDDEDGVTFLSSIVAGSPATVQVINGTGAGRLNAWMDFNGNGVFDVGPETIFSNLGLAAASVNTLTFTVPSTAVAGNSYSRFRLTAGASTAGPVGLDGYGEVEDYPVGIKPKEQELDYGDAPTFAAVPGYPTLLANNGARHVKIAKMPMLGGRWDSEPDGQPNVPSTGDDLGGIDDEDGVFIGANPLGTTPITPGSVVNLSITNGGSVAGKLNAWADWSQNFSWLNPGEQIATNINIGAGATLILPVAVPATVPAGTAVYFRFRINTAGGLAPTGLAADGEVEDYRAFTTQNFEKADWGDAPSKTQFGTSFPTLASENGPYHILNGNGPILGKLWDGEPDGQPTAGANGDDLNATDDEDGVFNSAGVKLDAATLTAGAINKIVVNVGGSGTGYVNGWADRNEDGDWNDAGEHFIVDALTTTTGTFNLALPAGITGKTVLRFRVSNTIGLNYFGGENDGEVEDYVSKVANAAGPVVVGTGLGYINDQSVSVLFDTPIDPATLDLTDLQATNLNDGSTPVAKSVSLNDDNTIATWVFNTPGTSLSDGHYKFLLPAVQLTDVDGNPNAPSLMEEEGIFFMAGDTNHDGTVNFGDLLSLSQHYGQPGDATDGDSNYDGLVNFSDLLSLSQHYGQTLAAAPSGFLFSTTPIGASSASKASDDDSVTSPESDVLA